MQSDFTDLKSDVRLLESKLTSLLKSRDRINTLVITLVIGAVFSAGIRPSIDSFLMIVDDKKGVLIGTNE